mmetsp:Transcript_48811/g.97401  ORF Transcript_48811/g.97401 Transcript_48811/m.97401 type:complete len:93 (+) Transcript_48811:76-354(+)
MNRPPKGQKSSRCCSLPTCAPKVQSLPLIGSAKAKREECCTLTTLKAAPDALLGGKAAQGGAAHPKRWGTMETAHRKRMNIFLRVRASAETL